MAKHVYVSKRAKGFNFTVVMEDAKGKETRTRVRFDHQQFVTEDDELAAAIDELMASNANISRNVQKADKAAAEALAVQHAEMMKRTGAVKGGVTAEAAKMAMDTSLMERDVELRSRNADTQAFADENLQLTEQAPPPIDPQQPANTEPTPDTHEEQGADAERPPSAGIKLG